MRMVLFLRCVILPVEGHHYVLGIVFMRYLVVFFLGS